MVRIKMAPDIEFRMDVELEGVDMGTRDHDLQLHKEAVYRLFAERLKKAFPESDFSIDTFVFGLDREKGEKAA